MAQIKSIYITPVDKLQKSMSKYKKAVQISIPQSYDLGFTPIKKQSEFPFTIFNPNSKPLNYIFKFTQFVISPSKGLLMPNSYSNFKIEFQANKAEVIVGTVIFEVEGEQQRVYKFSAIGKYPYISVGSDELNFGDVLVTKNVAKEIMLRNNSEVDAEFHIRKSTMPDFNDSFFHFHPQHGTVPAKAYYSVKVNYNPTFVDKKTIANISVKCQSGNQQQVKLKGKSNRFKVNFTSTSINFNEVKLDNSSTKVLTMTNDSQLQTQFQFFTDPNNVFSFNEVKGVIGRNTYKKIIIEFRPRNTIAYYERVYCLVRNHLLLFVDLIGTCYDLLIRPIPLMQVHVDTFRKRVIEGRISAIELKYIENNLLLKLAKRNLEDSSLNQTENFYETKHQIREHPLILHKELFLQNEQNQIIAINSDCVDFGYSQIMTLSGARQIEVTNKMQCKLNLNWISQKKQNLNGEYMTVFQVYPQSAVLKPNQPVKFNVSFRPLKSNTYYFQHLQFYATKHNTKITKKTLQEFQYKEVKAKPETTLLRNVKLAQTIQSKVKEDIETTEVLPSICRTVRCVGHSFSHSSLPFLPIMKITPNNRITFKPSLKNHSVYDSVVFTNQSDTPIYYKVGPDSAKVFRAYPKMGLIQPKSFTTLVLQFTPKEYKLYKSNLSLILNDMPSSNMKLSLTGICTEPQLQLQNNSQLFFAPTFTGVCTKKSYKITNTSKSKVTFRINVPQKYEQELSFEPRQKQLEANESFDVMAYFVPHFKKSYKVNVAIQAIQDVIMHDMNVGYHNPGSGTVGEFVQKEQIKKLFGLEVHGEGADGSIKISHQQIDFKTVKISEQKKLQFRLKNTASCSFFVQLSIRNNKFLQNYSPPSQAQLSSAFSLSFKEGIIPANSQVNVDVTFTPSDVHVYNLKLVVNAKEKLPKGTTLKSFKANNQPHMKSQMRILADGNYPLMEIIDIRNDTLSVAALWENFQIEKINNELSCKLDTNEKKYLNVQTLTYVEAKSLEANLKNYQWNLGYVSTKNKAKPRKVIITVKNYGGTPLDYNFKFPSDNKVEEQLWADPGEPTKEEAYEKAIIQNNIFQIKPKIGKLQPNEIKDVQLIYSPISLETMKLPNSSNEIHQLKVVFQIQNGKSLAFNLKGTTLGPNEGLLTVKKNHYVLPQTPIGCLQPLRFPIQLNNVGSIKVNYKTQVFYEEGQFEEVFVVENPSHFLMAGQNYYIYCFYKPLIQKKYNFKIAIHVFDGSKEIQSIPLTLQGKAVQKLTPILPSTIAKAIPHQRTTVSEIGSKVFFSIQEINFEEMQPEQIKYKMIILYNMSKQNSLSFDFPTQSALNASKVGLTCGDKFTIEPATGNLQPGKFLELKITLIACNSPSFYEGEVPCHIVWASNKYSAQDNDLTQKDVIITAKKESLFLRIKKLSCFTGKSAVKKYQQSNPKKSVMQCIFDTIVSSTLNDDDLEDIIQKVACQQKPLLDMMNPNNPVSIGQQSSAQNQEEEAGKDYSQYQNLLLNEQFKQITEIIMENTFFNIVQETTHQENDFLRVGKKYIQANKL